ncbi:hypothetical protein AB0M44_47015 [Streptosporangium subroseum]|uniref:hypothetical protein n=1 Tax=Streptosporangium subroseum TaxID=106412 RepID=UPI00342FB186
MPATARGRGWRMWITGGDDPLLAGWLAGYGTGVVASAVAYPDQQMTSFTALGYSFAAVHPGALCQVTSAEGLLTTSPSPAPGRH